MPDKHLSVFFSLHLDHFSQEVIKRGGLSPLLKARVSVLPRIRLLQQSEAESGSEGQTEEKLEARQPWKRKRMSNPYSQDC